MIEVLTEAGRKVTEHSIECLRRALEDLKANKHKYHPRTYRILEEPLVEEIELRQTEINKYLWQLDPQPDGVAVRDPEPDGPPTDETSEPLPVSDTLPREEEIAKLPRWARVAFAARCARRGLSVFRRDLHPDFKHHADDAAAKIASAEYPELIDDSAMTQFAAVIPDFNSGVHFLIAAQAARTAAARVLLKWDSASISASVFHVIRQIYIATAHVADIRPFVLADLKFLLRHSQLESWTDDTPVPPSVFGPLWPDGPPPGWPEDENPDRDLVLEIDLPDDATDADVKRYVELLVNKADDVYRAGGGNGLKISGLDITGEKLVAKPSPDSTQPSEELVGGAT